MITLVIKGNVFAAKKKTDALGIALSAAKGDETQTIATCDRRYLTDVVRWFCTTTHTEDAPFPDGTLFFYNWSDES